jgi:hypothetical protein
MRDLMSFTGSCCVYCGDDLEFAPMREIHVDHILPISRRGASSIGNLIMCCKSCSLSKGDKPAAIFADDPTSLVRFISQEQGISKVEATVILLGDGLAADGVKNAEQVVVVSIILEAMKVKDYAPIELKISAIQHYFAHKFKLTIDDPDDVTAIREAIQALIEYEKESQ